MTFFDQEDVERTLDTLAKCDRLTVFVGAGTSMEVGLPSWNGLLERLLDKIASKAKLSAEQSEQFLAAVRAEVDDVLGIGSIVRAQLGPQADQYIREALYADPAHVSAKVSASLGYGPTPIEVSRLVSAWPCGAVEVITTNYDLLIEKALRDHFASRTAQGQAHFTGSADVVAAVIPGRDGDIFDAGTYLVRHLHGALGETKGGEDLLPAVLAEGDYHSVQTSDSWQAAYLPDRLEKTACLFLGASMTDANMLRFLRIADTPKSKTRHVALLVRDNELAPDDPAVSELLAAGSRARWEQYNVEVLPPRYFADVAQFVAEVTRRRERINGVGRLIKGDRFSARMKAWTTKTAKKGGPLCLLPAAAFSVAQDDVVKALSGWKDAVVDIIKAPEASEEVFGLQLWVPNADASELVMYGQSAAAWRDQAQFSGLKIKPGTKWLSVETWCRGTPMYKPFDESHGTRWSSGIGVPIILTDAVHGRLPVGVMTLSVMGTVEPRLLEKLGAQELQEIIASLNAAAIDFLTGKTTI